MATFCMLSSNNIHTPINKAVVNNQQVQRAYLRFSRVNELVRNPVQVIHRPGLVQRRVHMVPVLLAQIS